jgi:hypothetical protein
VSDSTPDQSQPIASESSALAAAEPTLVLPPEIATPESTSTPPSESTPMLDVHPAHHAASSWREFFVHIATIVLGLLIAVGLEQTVEYIHDRHQTRELRAGIITDAQIYLQDVDQLRHATRQTVEDLSTRILQVRRAGAAHQPLGPVSYRPDLPTNTIRLAYSSAAKASGRLHLLPEEEINTLAEAEVGIVKSEMLKERVLEAKRRRLDFEHLFQSGDSPAPNDFSAILPTQLAEYLSLLVAERDRCTEFLDYLDLMHNGSTAYLQGERDIQKVRGAEIKRPAPTAH